MTRPESQQKCMYCERQAQASLVYGKRRFIPACSEHMTAARRDIVDSGYAVDDKVVIENFWGQRVTSKRLASLHEAPPAEPPVRLSKLTLLQRLGEKWTTIRARKISDRVDMLIDGDRYTVWAKG
jgi:hypothetical protein